jgi:hypothetical protein
VVAVNGAGDNRYWLWQSGDAAPRSLPAEPVVITANAAGSRPSASSRYTGPA